MSLNIAFTASIVLALTFGCKSIEKSSRDSDAASLQSSAEQSIAAQVALHQSVIARSPALFGQQIRSNDLDAARKTAETMYRTLEALESSRQLASQVCFGGAEMACSTFRKYMSQDIKSLYEGFVVSNSLSTGELLKIATKIETSASLQYR